MVKYVNFFKENKEVQRGASRNKCRKERRDEKKNVTE